MQGREVQELEVAPRQKEVAKQRRQEQAQDRPCVRERQRPAEEECSQHSLVDQRNPPREKQERQHDAQDVPDRQQGLCCIPPGNKARCERQQGAQYCSSHCQVETGARQVLPLESQIPRHAVHKPDHQHAEEHAEGRGQLARQQVPCLVGLQRMRVPLYGQAQRTGSHADTDRPDKHEATETAPQHDSQVRTRLAARVAEKPEQPQQHSTRADNADADDPDRTILPRCMHPRYGPIGRRVGGREKSHERKRKPGHGKPFREPRCLNEIVAGPCVIARLCHELPRPKIQGSQGQPCEQGHEPQLQVDAEQIAQVERSNECPVERSARNQISAIGTKPPDKPTRAGIADFLLNAVKVRTLCRPAKEPAEHPSCVSPTRDRGNQIKTKERALLGQRAQQPEAKRGAANTSTRKGQPPLVFRPLKDGISQRSTAPGHLVVDSAHRIPLQRHLMRPVRRPPMLPWMRIQ